MILPIFEPAVPALLAATGSILAAAGMLIIAGRRRRSFVALGAFVLVAGVAIVSPPTTSHTTHLALTATKSATFSALSRIHDRGPDLPTEDLRQLEGEVLAVKTDMAP